MRLLVVLPNGIEGAGSSNDILVIFGEKRTGSGRERLEAKDHLKLNRGGSCGRMKLPFKAFA